MKDQLQNYFTENLPRFIDILRQMVTTNSFTANAKGVNTVADITAQNFVQLGFKDERVPAANPDFGKHQVLTRAGKSNKVIGLISHLDTVFPVDEEIANNFSWQVEGDRIYGPGTNDIKGGTVVAYMVMEALKEFYPEAFDEITWVVLINAAEERWSFDFGTLCRQRLGPEALAALVFEAGYMDDGIFSLVAARKGMAIYDIHIEGKSAHAGNGHKAGANANIQMAQVIQKIADLTNYDQDLTFNVGVLNGGTVPNRVPHFATARGEMRTFSQDIFDKAVTKLLALNDLTPIQSHAGDFACKINIQVIQKNAPWPQNTQTDQLLSLWQETGKELGLTLYREERGGLSDGNQLWDFVPTIDGLGPSGGNAHCSERSPDGSKEQEFCTLSSFVPKAVLNTLAIMKLVG
jgi:glutamate carboxypeptidase